MITKKNRLKLLLMLLPICLCSCGSKPGRIPRTFSFIKYEDFYSEYVYQNGYVNEPAHLVDLERLNLNHVLDEGHFLLNGLDACKKYLKVDCSKIETHHVLNEKFYQYRSWFSVPSETSIMIYGDFDATYYAIDTKKNIDIKLDDKIELIQGKESSTHYTIKKGGFELLYFDLTYTFYESEEASEEELKIANEEAAESTSNILEKLNLIYKNYKYSNLV